MMMYNTQNYWVLGLCSSSVIIKNTTKHASETGCFHPQVRGEAPTLLGLLEKADSG
jgi:hypothetical protein